MEEENKEENKEIVEEDKLPAKKEDKKTLIQSAKDAAIELRVENEKKEKLLKEEKEILERREALAALGGDSSVGKKEKIDEEATPEKINEELGNLGW